MAELQQFPERGPTPERRQHDRITRDEQQTADADGLIGHPWRAEGLLARLERRGAIGRLERQAGEEFARLFHLAHCDPLRAADMSRTPISGGKLAGDVSHSSERSRRRVHEALDALGGLTSPCGSAAWHIIGEGMNVQEWARRAGWSGRQLKPEVAKGTLLATLSVLAGHFARGRK